MSAPEQPVVLGPFVAPGDPTVLPPIVSDVWGRRDYVTRRALLLADVLALLVAFVVALYLLSPFPRPASSFVAALCTLPVWVLILKAYGLYDRDGRRISHSTVDDLPWVVHALLVGTLLTWAIFKLLPVHHLAFIEIAVFDLVAVVGIGIGRWFVRTRLLPSLIEPERLLVLGHSRMRGVLMRKIAAHPEYHLKPVGEVLEPGALDGPGRDLPDPSAELPTLGTMDDLP